MGRSQLYYIEEDSGLVIGNICNKREIIFFCSIYVGFYSGFLLFIEKILKHSHLPYCVRKNQADGQMSGKDQNP